MEDNPRRNGEESGRHCVWGVAQGVLFRPDCDEDVRGGCPPPSWQQVSCRFSQRRFPARVLLKQVLFCMLTFSWLSLLP